MQDVLLRPHSAGDCFKLGLRIYQSHFVPLLVLSVTLFAPAVAFGLWDIQLGQNILVLMTHLLEAAIALGMMVLLFQPVFPAIGILRIGRSTLAAGALHVALLQWLITLCGILILQLPLAVAFVLLFLWVYCLFAINLAQPVFLVEGLRGGQAIKRSFQLVYQSFGKVFGTLLLLFLFRLVVFYGCLILFLSNLEIHHMLEDPFRPVVEALGSQEGLLQISQAHFVTEVLVQPLSAVVLFILYISLRIQESPIDVTQMQQVVSPLLTETDEDQNN